MSECEMKNCSGLVYARGLCRKHYERNRKYGSPSDRLNARADARTRFWRFVEKRGPDECWEWAGGRNKNKYGVFGLGAASDGRTTAHRYSYILHCGEVPQGMIVMHTCDNPPCCNPRHLRLGTHAENTADMHEKNRANRPRGLESSQAKLDDEKVRFIRASPLSTRKLAELLGVGPTTIRGVRNGRVWSHVK